MQNELVCVRCGRQPRDGTAYICFECHFASEMQSEMAAVSHLEGARAQRRELVNQFGWHGGWEVRLRRDVIGA